MADVELAVKVDVSGARDVDKLGRLVRFRGRTCRHALDPGGSGGRARSGHSRAGPPWGSRKRASISRSRRSAARSSWPPRKRESASKVNTALRGFGRQDRGRRGDRGRPREYELRRIPHGRGQPGQPRAEHGPLGEGLRGYVGRDDSARGRHGLVQQCRPGRRTGGHAVGPHGRDGAPEEVRRDAQRGLDTAGGREARAIRRRGGALEIGPGSRHVSAPPRPDDESARRPGAHLGRPRESSRRRGPRNRKRHGRTSGRRSCPWPRR